MLGGVDPWGNFQQTTGGPWSVEFESIDLESNSSPNSEAIFKFQIADNKKPNNAKQVWILNKIEQVTINKQCEIIVSEPRFVVDIYSAANGLESKGGVTSFRDANANIEIPNDLLLFGVPMKASEPICMSFQKITKVVGFNAQGFWGNPITFPSLTNRPVNWHDLPILFMRGPKFTFVEEHFVFNKKGCSCLKGCLPAKLLPDSYECISYPEQGLSTCNDSPAEFVKKTFPLNSLP